ncbi:MAG: diguanylate cyclase [Sphaerochaetaceae bacterium]
MTNPFSACTEFLKNDHKSFTDNRKEFENHNTETIRMLSPIYFGLLCFFFIINHYNFHNNRLDIITFVTIVLQSIFILSYSITLMERRPEKRMSTRKTMCYRHIFVTLLMTFAITSSVLPFPQSPSITFSILLICTTVIFIESFFFRLLFNLLYVLIFLLAIQKFKSGDILFLDRINAVLGFVCSEICSYIIGSLRNKESSTTNELKRFVSIDSLTGVLNKGATEQQCREYLKETKGAESSAMLMMDLDNFKTINDELGHKQGDYVLSKFGQLLRDNFGYEDIIGRVGGDEFLVLMKNTDDLKGIRNTLDRFVGQVAKIFSEYSVTRLTCCIGIAKNSHNLQLFDTQMYRADTALYVAKEKGKNQYYFYSETIETTTSKPLMLIADTTEVGRAILSNIFKKDFSLIQAHTGKQTLQQMRHYCHILSVVLLNWNMTDPDCHDLLRIVQINEDLKHLPIVVIADPGTPESKALKLGVVSFIHKPYNPDSVKSIIENSMRKIN